MSGLEDPSAECQPTRMPLKPTQGGFDAFSVLALALAVEELVEAVPYNPLKAQPRGNGRKQDEHAGPSDAAQVPPHTQIVNHLVEHNRRNGTLGPPMMSNLRQ
jgi:hypothetical protein